MWFLVAGFVFAALVLAVAVGLARRIFRKLRAFHGRFLWLEESAVQTGKHLGDEFAAQQRSIGASRIRGHAQDLSAIENGQWECLAGVGNSPWKISDFKRARGLAVFRGEIHVGLESRAAGRAEAWKRSHDGSWTRIGGHGINGSWGRADEVTRLFSFKDHLYAGLGCHVHGASVWRWNGEAWDQVAGGKAAPWAADDYVVAQSMAADDHLLYVGLWAREDKPWIGPAIFAFDGQTWVDLPGTDWPGDEPEQGVYEQLVGNSGELLAGFGGDQGAAKLWSLRNRKWNQIGGQGVGPGWHSLSADYILALAEYDGHYIASTERIPTVPGDFSTVWAYDIAHENWAPVGAAGVPGQWWRMHSYNALSVYRNNLLLGAGGAPGGKASIWYLDGGGEWRLWAGYGANGSWGDSAGSTPLWKKSNREYVYRLLQHDQDLIVGMGASVGCAQVWRFRPADTSSNELTA